MQWPLKVVSSLDFFLPSCLYILLFLDAVYSGTKKNRDFELIVIINFNRCAERFFVFFSRRLPEEGKWVSLKEFWLTSRLDPQLEYRLASLIQTVQFSDWTWGTSRQVTSKTSSILTLQYSGYVNMGSIGSVEPMEFRRRVQESIDFEQIVKQMQENKMFELWFSLKSS